MMPFHAFGFPVPRSSPPLLSRWGRLCCAVLVTLVGMGFGLVGCAPPPPVDRVELELEVRKGLSYLKGTDQLYTGNFILLGKRGGKVEEAQYAEGRLEGASRTYLESTGALRRQIDYVNGSRVRKRSWYPNGQLRADETWRGEAVFGNCTYWFEDGRIRKQLSFVQDFQADGQVIEYAEDGTVVLDVIMDQGRYVKGIYPPGMDFRTVGKRYFSDTAGEKSDLEDGPKAKVKTAQR